MLEEGAGLDLRAAYGGLIPFVGWVEVAFQLTSDAQSSVPLTVQILVARDKLEHPIIGYNIIEKVTRNKGQEGGEDVVIDMMSSALVDANVEKVSALVDFVQGPMEESLCCFRNGRNSLTVLAGQTVMVPCHVSCGPLERRTPVVFEPSRDESGPVDLAVSEQLLTWGTQQS